MANICSVDFLLTFRDKGKCAKFADLFRKKINEAEKRDEGVCISQDTWLFDVVMDTAEKRCISLKGWVRWSLAHEAIREFVEFLKEAGLESLECEYEETGNLIYGKYEFHNGELWDSFIEESHPIWESVSAGDDDCYDRLEEALENDGETVMVA